MSLRLRSFRRIVVFALPCWLVGGPLATTMQSIAACPHHDMMSEGAAHHGDAPCWCGHMTGNATPDVPTPPALPGTAASAQSAPVAIVSLIPAAPLLPDSPSFPPSPPPPNGSH